MSDVRVLGAIGVVELRSPPKEPAKLQQALVRQRGVAPTFRPNHLHNATLHHFRAGAQVHYQGHCRSA